MSRTTRSRRCLLRDKIAVMSHGVIEQLGAPQEIYDRPASVFVADFIGSPPMNPLTFHDSVEPGRGQVRLGAPIAVPRRARVVGARSDPRRRSRACAPERSGPVARRGSRHRYLGTTQIVTVTTPHGLAKARLPRDLKASVGGLGDSISAATASRCSTPLPAAPFRPCSTITRARWSSPMLRSCSRTFERFGATSAVSDLLASSTTAHSSCCSADRAGRPRLRAWSAALEKPDAGRIRIAGLDVTSASPAQRDVAFVFQQSSLYPHLSGLTIRPSRCALPHGGRRTTDPSAGQRVTALLDLDKLEERVTRLPGGQMQRVAIGRALVRSPSIYLMDEAAFVAGRRVARRIAHRAQAHRNRARRRSSMSHTTRRKR